MRHRAALGFVTCALACGASGVDDARDQLRAGHIDAAITLLRAEIAKDPAAAAPTILLADVLIAQERLEEAGEIIESGLARNSSISGLHRVMGDLRFREGRIFDADKAYKAAIKLDGKDVRAIYGESRVFESTCLRKRARDLLDIAHAINRHDPLVNAALYANDRRSAAAIAAMEAELARGVAGEDDQPGRIRTLKAWIAEAKAFDGKTEFELAGPYQHSRIPMYALRNGNRVTGEGVPIKIGDVKGELRFDTGAPGILLNPRAAERAGIQRLAESEIKGIGNDPALKGWVGLAPSIHFGDVEFKNCIVRVSEKNSVDESDGLLGPDIFRRFVVKINLAARSLELDPLPGPAWDGQTPVDRYEGPELSGFDQVIVIRHYLLVPTLVSESTKAGQTPGLFLLDTGARLNMISTNLAPEVAKVHNSQTTRVQGLSGKVKMVYEADQVVLQFGHFRQTNLGLTSFDLSSFSRGAGAEISGILGLPLIEMFQSVAIDYRDGRVKFDYKK